MPLFRWPLVLLLPCRSKRYGCRHKTLRRYRETLTNFIVSQHICCGSGSCSVAAGRLFKGLHVSES
ncbi:hypothetical protein Hdeb2414_s0008g00294651 [Helianthus debilis subsp. tardiflorus]